MRFVKAVITITVAVMISSCAPKTDKKLDLNDSNRILTLKGRAYLQPLDKIIALSFASSKATVFFDFVDSTYCNVTINSAAGSIVQSRKYTIDSSRTLILFNPLNDRKKSFGLSINSDTTIYLKNKKGISLYKLIPCNNNVNLLFLSSNRLKKQEFLYPTLSEKEREFGAENQYVDMGNGRYMTKTHPLKGTISKINIYKLF